MSVDAADLAQLARMLDLRIPKDALERLAPAVAKMYADLEQLRDLPIDGRTPALPPLAPSAAARPPETAR
jgi:Asp-tRNA(Asn)/Glu-tRNA(Gln) amidotransferase C subunit